MTESLEDCSSIFLDINGSLILILHTDATTEVNMFECDTNRFKIVNDFNNTLHCFRERGDIGNLRTDMTVYSDDFNMG